MARIKSLPKKNLPRQGQSSKHREKETKRNKNPDWLKANKYGQILSLPKLPFSRVVRDIILGFSSNRDIRISVVAMNALHEASESYMVHFFEDLNMLAMHAKRVTVMIRDFELQKRLRAAKALGGIPDR